MHYEIQNLPLKRNFQMWKRHRFGDKTVVRRPILAPNPAVGLNFFPFFVMTQRKSKSLVRIPEDIRKNQHMDIVCANLLSFSFLQA